MEVEITTLRGRDGEACLIMKPKHLVDFIRDNINDEAAEYVENLLTTMEDTQDKEQREIMEIAENMASDARDLAEMPSDMFERRSRL